MVALVFVLVGALLFTADDAALAQEESSTVHAVIEARGRPAVTAVDSTDHPVVGYVYFGDYTADADRAIKVVRCTDPRCEGTIVNRVVDLGSGSWAQSDFDVSMVLDQFDLPVFSYIEGGMVKIARCQDQNCAVVDTAVIGFGLRTSLAVDGNGNVVIGYRAAAVEGNSLVWDVEVARCHDASCEGLTRYTIEEAASPGAGPLTVAVDSNENIVVGYVRRAGVAVIARCHDSDCSSISRTAVGVASSMAMKLDSNNFPVILTATYNDANIQFVGCHDVDCVEADTKDFRPRLEGFRGISSDSLAIGPDDSATFILPEEGDGDDYPMIVHCRDKACELPESGGAIGGRPVNATRPTPLALDSNGYPVAAYWNQRRGLVVAVCGSSVCSNDAGIGIQGTFYLQNVRTGRYLDVDADSSVGTSAEPRSDDVWELGLMGNYQSLRSVDYDMYLGIDRGQVIVEDTPAQRWLISQFEAGAVLIKPPYAQYLAVAASRDVELARTPDGGRASWRLVPVEPAEPNSFVGTRLGLQNSVTGRWLDGDRDGDVNQSVRQSDDDIWLVQDAGDGYVHLVNESTNRYLDADEGKIDVDSSTSDGNDTRWDLAEHEGTVVLRNVRFDGHLTAADKTQSYNTTRSDLSLSSYWHPVIIE